MMILVKHTKQLLCRTAQSIAKVGSNVDEANGEVADTQSDIGWAIIHSTAGH
jgi:hypothetical protein